MTLLRAPVMRLTTTSLRPGGETPIFSTTSNWRAIYAVELGPIIKAGDLLDISFTLHVTNDAFRPNANPVTWGAQVRLSPTIGDTSDGNQMIPTMQPHNIGDAAHHGLLVARYLYQVPETLYGTYYAKLLAWFRHPSANGSQQMACPDNGFGMQVIWHRS